MCEQSKQIEREVLNNSIPPSGYSTNFNILYPNIFNIYAASFAYFWIYKYNPIMKPFHNYKIILSNLNIKF